MGRSFFPNAGGPRSHLLTLALLLVANTVNCSFCCCFTSSHWGIATSRVAFCAKLLAECNFETPVLCQAIGELQLAGFRVAPSYWGSAILSPVLCQAIGELQFAVLRCFKPLGNHNSQGFALCQAGYWFAPNYCDFEAPVLCQAIRELQLAASCFASSYWGITICRVLRCVKLLGSSNVQGIVLCKLLNL